MRPIIGITCGQILSKKSPWSPTVYGQSHTYVGAIIRAGGTPVLLPLSINPSVLRQLYELLDGILLAGGNDPHPELYGQKPYPQVTDYDQLRDATEQQLVNWALTDSKPLLGICRGMEMINIARGGILHQHLPKDIPGGIDHESSTKAQDLEHPAHRLRVRPGSELERILGVEHINVNSHHHQGIAKLGKNINASAWAEDNLIEAIELTDHPFALGVQGHPESLDERAVPEWQRLFAAFVTAAQPAESASQKSVSQLTT